MSSSIYETEFQIPLQRAKHDTREQAHSALKAELAASRAREAVLQRQMVEASQRRDMLAREFEHRLVNGLQLIASLLSLQSRTATTPEASVQLRIAARRVTALGRVHHRLHLLDHQNHVEFGQYLRHLCADLSGLLFQERTDQAIVVEGASAEIPTVVAVPLGFIVNELVTNSAKYAQGNIVVRFEAATSGGHLLSVRDGGLGLPVGFDPAKSRGLGMKIVLSLVKQIGGTLQFTPGDDDRGACFTVAFTTPKVDSRGAGRADSSIEKEST